jgi:hypothetical protein
MAGGQEDTMGEVKDTLTVTDNRTGSSYEIPVVDDTIRATSRCHALCVPSVRIRVSGVTGRAPTLAPARPASGVAGVRP